MGPAGPQGPAGAAAPRPRIFQISCSQAGGNAFTTAQTNTCACPLDAHVVSGGYYITGFYETTVSVQESHNFAVPGNAWRVRAIRTGDNVAWGIAVVVNCMRGIEYNVNPY